MRSSWKVSTKSEGCFAISEAGTSVEWGGDGTTRVYKVSFDASNCSDRYGDYIEVKPLYESTLICIRY